MNGKQQNLASSHIRPSGNALPAWWLVFKRELADLWIGGKAFNMILIYSILLGAMVYVYSFNTELSLIPPKEAVYEMLKNAMAFCMFVGLVVGADTLSGERERSTLESLLLTPVSRRQIITGKFLAGISCWPVAYLAAIPYLYVLSQGDEVLIPAIMWGALTGTILVLAYTGLGMLISFWSSSNKISYFVSLGIFALLLVPAELPGKSNGAAGQFLQWVNPMAAVNHFLSKHLVNYEPVSLYWPWLESAVAFLLLVAGLLFPYAGPRLRLEAGKPSKFWVNIGRMVGISVLTCFLLVTSMLPASAHQISPSALQISIDLNSTQVKTGDKVEYNTVVSNNGTEASPPFIVAMNVINLDAKGEVVDPEDWSPQRTQYVDSLTAGQSASQHWIINTILEGDYMVYMVLVPKPDRPESTAQTISTSGIHLTVAPFTRLNPEGVLPYVVGVPLLVLLGTVLFYRFRRRHVDEGDQK